jgi:two-component system sensor histidine kinase BarA
VKYRIRRFAGAISIYIFGVFVIAAVSYMQERQRFLADIDTRLLAAASNLSNILPADFHDVARTPNAISTEQDQFNLELMTRHAQSGDLTYLYSYVMVEGKIHFTSCNYTAEDIKENRVVTYWTDYPEGAQEYSDAMTASEPIYVTAGDRWGLFRTILMPMTSPSGLPYVAAADMDITVIENSLKHAVLSVLGMSLVLLVIAVPLILVYMRTYSEMNSELKVLNKQLQADINQALILEADLKQATHDANSASDIKSQFLSNMSHELRTPINGISGMNQLLLETELTAEQKEYIQLCNSSANVLLDTINQILDVAAIESGGIKLDCKAVNSQTFFDDILGMFSAQLRDKDLDLTLSLSASMPDELNIDPIHLRKVFINLISNAIKFTQTGGIKVLVSWRGGRLHGVVQDSGSGIPNEAQQRIFETFQQVDNSYTREYGGTGLGLPISRQICHMMGGELRLHHSNEQGSTFKFHIQAAASSDEQVPLFEPSANLKICVFTDSEILRAWFFSELGQSNFSSLASIQDGMPDISNCTHILVDSAASENDLVLLARAIDHTQQVIIYLSWVGYSLPKRLKDSIRVARKPFGRKGLATLIKTSDRLRK